MENNSELGEKAYLVIIEEHGKEVNEFHAINKETIDELELNDILQKIEKVGEYVEIDENINFCNPIKQEFSDDYYQNDHVVSDGNISILSENDSCAGSDITDSNDRFLLRRKMLSPLHQYSTVQELRNEDPNLCEDLTALTTALLKKMRDIKKPPLPRPHFELMKNGKYKCIKCNRLTESKPAAGRHYAEFHGPRYLKCFACGVDFRSNTNLYKHEKRCPAPDAKIVLKARAIYLGKKGRGRPYLKHYKEENLNCQLCPAKFRCIQGLEAHERMHRGERPYNCDQCPRAYTSVSAFRRHLATHSGEQFACHHCGRSFKCRSTLITHLYTHEKEKRFACDECPRRFRTNLALSLHIRREHLKLPPPCACKLCPKRYPRMYLLNAHMKRAHGVTLITRNMFWKRLPLLSNMEVEQATLVINDQIQMSKQEDSS